MIINDCYMENLKAQKNIYFFFVQQNYSLNTRKFSQHIAP